MKEKKGNKYLIASVYYIIGNIIGQGVVLLSSGIFTRIMSKEAYGLVNTYSAWVLVLNTFIGLNLFITVRNAYLDYREDYKRYQSSVLLFSLVAFLCLTITIISVVVIFKIDADVFVILVAAIQAISVHTVNYEMAVLSMEGKYKPRTMLMALPNIFHTILSIILILIYSSNQYYGKIIGNSLGIAVFAIIIIVYVFHNEKPVFIKEYWRYAAIIGIPAIMCTLSDLILMESDRIMLTEMVGAEETAVYSLIYNIGSILIALYTAINGSWTPWFYKNLEKGSIKEIRKVEAAYIAVFTFITIGLLTISPEIIKILSPRTYWGGINYVGLIVIASFLIFLYTFFTTYLMYLKKTGIIAINTTIAALLNLVLNYLFIPEYKSEGAAYATITSYVVLFILHWLATLKYSRNVIDMKAFLICIIILVLYSVLFNFISAGYIIRYGIVGLMFIVMVTALLFYKKKKDMKKEKGD